jgi:hypothetical protein
MTYVIDGYMLDGGLMNNDISEHDITVTDNSNECNFFDVNESALN